MKIENLEQFKNTPESFPEVIIIPMEKFSSKLTPIFESDIFDKTSGVKIGHLDFKLNHNQKIITIESIVIQIPKQGYGVSLYNTLQSMFPKYQLISSGQMRAKSIESQEKPDAVYLWEKLVSLGYAEGDRINGFKMKK
jgi:hypothetical protein